MSIQCIDLGLLAHGNCTYDEENKEEWLRVSKQLSKTLENTGFAYIKNHGIPEELIDEIHKMGDVIFSLPKETKEKYKKVSVQGYVEPNREKLLSSKDKLELRESFDIKSFSQAVPPEIEKFRGDYGDFTEHLKSLAYKLLRCIEIGLDISKGLLLSNHMMVLTKENCSIVRIIHYPPIPSETKEEVIRCGTHSDYGTLTLLFQDDMGGLEVKNRDNLWIKADPIPGTILINVGDLLEMWTDGKFIATKHRVIVPEEEIKQRCPRRSMVFFLHPDNGIVVKPFNGSSAYTPIKAEDHLWKRYHETYDNLTR